MSGRDLGDALYRALSNGRSPATEPDSVAGSIAWYMKHAGSESAAARMAGIPRRTFRDWRSGASKPKGGRGGELVRAARQGERRLRLKPGREARLRDADPSAIKMHATYNYDGIERKNINIGQYLDDDAMNDFCDAFLAGADIDGLRDTFADSITQDDSGFYERTMRLPTTDSHGWTVENITLEES